MKSTQLLSVVFSLIMFTGVTTGSVAFAQSDDLDDILEGFCEMTFDEQSEIIFDYNLEEFQEKLETVCEIEDIDEREYALEDVIDAIVGETRDEYSDFDDVGYETSDYDVDDDTDRYDKYDLDDKLEYYCQMTVDEKRQFFENHPRFVQFKDRLENICDMADDKRRDALKDFMIQHKDMIKDHVKDYVKDHMKYKFSTMEFDRFCSMTDSELAAATFDAEFVERASKWCDMTPEDRADYKKDHMKDKVTDYVKDKFSHMDYDRLCALAESDRAAEITDVAKLDRISKWCDMTPDQRADYKKDHMKYMVKDKMRDKFSHMDFEKYCSMTDGDLATTTFDAEFVEKASKWCDMTPEDRADYKKDHMKAKVKHMMDSDMSPRLKAMIMAKSVTDEKREEIKMKFMAKHGDKADKLKSELKMKYKDHMLKFKSKFTDERKAAIHDRLADMKAFKAELRDKASELTDEEKQQLRADFIEKAKDMQLAWISPRVQMNAGVDVAEIECREGFNLVMKSSNGVPMCLKANTALKLIEKGIAVPAN